MSNALQRDLVHLVSAVEGRALERGHGRYAQRFHIMPPTGWLNDPNGLCQKDGIFHAYFQYAPFDVNGGVKMWGHAESHDLLTWTYTGTPLYPDEPFDCHGVYSGSALVEDGRIRVLYTGNVKLADPDGAFDYVNAGRRADTVLVESGDGRTFGGKRVVIPSGDYPDDLTCHVRDPKVWRGADGRYHLLLGARRRVDGPHVESRFCAMHGEGAGRDEGEILVWGSDDMRAWSLENRISTAERFGFMWECPGYIELPGASGSPALNVLSFSPQGLEGGRWDRGNLYATGYMRVTGDITGGGDCALDSFELWDAGFDFYAPQEFEAEDGRHILIGWMGMPDEPTYGNDPTVACGWQHCLTLPRELTAGPDGRVLQAPVRELEGFHASARSAVGAIDVTGDSCFDVQVSGVQGRIEAVVDGELSLALCPADGFSPSRFEMRFIDPSRSAAGCGRTVRWEPVDDVHDVRVVADVSSVEVFVNGGSLVMSTRIYPAAYGLRIVAPDARIDYARLERA